MDPSQFFQDSWQDDNRMRSLYAEFRSKSLNPEGYNTKMNDWICALNKLCMAEKRIVFDADWLKRFFERDGAYQPQCLHTVLNEMENQKMLSNMNDFQSTLKTRSWFAWGFDCFLKKPLSWGFSFLQESLLGGQPTTGQTEYIHLAVLKEIGNLVLIKLENKIEAENIKTMIDCKLFHVGSCRDLVKDYKVFFLVLSYLESQDQIVILKEQENNYIKMKQARNEIPVLNETDIGIMKLQKALQQIEVETEKFEQDMNTCKEEAKLALRNKNRPKAEALLRKKHRIEKQLQDKLKSANNIENMLHQLESSFTNTDVLNALKAGSSAQKKIAADGMNIKQIEETMEEIEETFEENSQIGDILSQKMYFGMNLDNDDELEVELDELLELDRLNQLVEEPKKNILKPSVVAFEDQDLVLPNVPTDSPTAIKEKKMASQIYE